MYKSYFKSLEGQQYRILFLPNIEVKTKNKIINIYDNDFQEINLLNDSVTISNNHNNKDFGIFSNKFECTLFLNQEEIFNLYNSKNCYVIVHNITEKKDDDYIYYDTERENLNENIIFYGLLDFKTLNQTFTTEKTEINIIAYDFIEDSKNEKLYHYLENTDIKIEKDYTSFRNLILHIAKNNYFENVYLDNNYILSDSENLLNQLLINNDLYKDNKEISIYEALEQILIDLGLICVSYNNSLYIYAKMQNNSKNIDKQYIELKLYKLVNDIEELPYYEHSLNYIINKNTIEYREQAQVLYLPYYTDIEAEHFFSNDSNISIKPFENYTYEYEKKLYEKTDIIGEISKLPIKENTIYENLGIIEGGRGMYGFTYRENGKGQHYNYWNGTITDDGNKENVHILTYHREKDKNCTFFYRYSIIDNKALNSDIIEEINFYNYDSWKGTTQENNITENREFNISNFKNNNIGCIIEYSDDEKTNSYEKQELKRALYISNGKYYDGLQKPHLKPNEVAKKMNQFVPLVEITTKDYLFNKNKGSKLILDFDYKIFSNYLMLPFQIKSSKYKQSTYLLNTDPYLYVQIQIGNLYYNSDTRKWQSEKVIAKIPLSRNEGNVYENNNFKPLDNISNNRKIDYDIKGFAIDIPNLENGNIYKDKIKLAFYRPNMYEFNILNLSNAIIENINIGFARELSNYKILKDTDNKKEEANNNNSDKKNKNTFTFFFDSGYKNDEEIYKNTFLYLDREEVNILENFIDTSKGAILDSHFDILQIYYEKIANQGKFLEFNTTLRNDFIDDRERQIITNYNYHHLPNKSLFIKNFSNNLLTDELLINFIENNF